MLNNRMAAVGLALILITAAAHCCSPDHSILAQGRVSCRKLRSAYVHHYFPEGTISARTCLRQGSVIQLCQFSSAWGVTANPATMSNLIVSYAPGVSSVSTSKGSMQLSYRESPATILLSRTFSYPTTDPGNFYISVTYLVSMANANNQSILESRSTE